MWLILISCGLFFLVFCLVVGFVFDDVVGCLEYVLRKIVLDKISVWLILFNVIFVCFWFFGESDCLENKMCMY